jgi:hypothetical protein
MKDKVKVVDYREELYNKQELEAIQNNLLTIPQLQKVLRLGSSSIYNLFKKGALQPVRFMNRYYIPKEQIYNLISPIEEQKKNTDYELSKGMKNYLGLDLEEDAILPVKTPALVKDKRTGKAILQDNKNKTPNKANTGILKIRITK